MAKKKQAGDRHVSRTLVGVPTELYAVVKERAALNGRPASWELRILIEAGIKALPIQGRKE